MKRCPTCGEHKPLSSFYTNGAQPSGKTKYKPTCKSCELAAKGARLREIVAEFYGKLACMRCGYSKSFAALQLHHRNPSEKDHGVANIKTHSKAKIIAELKKCDLLCANCHAEHHEAEHRGRIGIDAA